MELKLRKLSSDGILSLTSPRVVVAAGSGLVAHICPRQHGWWLYPLAPHSPLVCHNKEPLATPQSLRLGDLIFMLGNDWVVDSLESPEEALDQVSSDERRTPCRVALDDGTEVETAADLVIGTAEGCGLQLPEGSGAAAQHALLAFSEGGWHLHDLTGAGLALSGEEERCLCRPVEDRNVIRLGNVDLTFWTISPPRVAPVVEYTPVSETDDQTALDLPGIEPDHATPTTDAADAASRILAGQTVVAEAPDGSESGVSSFTDHSVMEAETDLVADPVSAAGWDLCRWLQGAIRKAGPRRGGIDASLAVRQLVGSWTRPADPIVALQQLRSRLAEAPCDRQGLQDVARFFEQLGYLDLCRFILKEMLWLNRDDVDVLAAITRVYFQQARAVDCPLAQRRDALERAQKYAGRAASLRPADLGLQQLRREVAAEWTLAKF